MYTLLFIDLKQKKTKIMRKTLPKKWCIKDCKETTQYMHKNYGTDNIVFKNKFLHINTTNKDWIYKEYVITDYTEITLEEFKTLVLKEKDVIEKPQTFCIEGKSHQIKAIYQDLVNMGYTYEKGFGINEVKKTDTKLSQNKNPQKIANIEEFKELAAHSFNDRYDVIFNLPQDYSKVLEFAKKQLEHPYWSKEIIVELNSDDKIFEVKVDPGKSITFDGENIKIADLKMLILFGGKVNNWIYNFEYVSIGCKHNIPIRDIQKVIDAYNKK